MNIPLIAWQAQLSSLYNASRHDTKMRIALGIMTVISISLGFWFTNQLAAQLHFWMAQGPLVTAAGLWSVCLQTWAGMAFFTIIGVQQALSSDEAILLSTLPITRATRFRMLFGSFFLENIGPWFLLQAIVMGYTLVSALGWQVTGWLVLLQAGIFVSVFAVLTITLLFIYAFMLRQYLTIGLVCIVTLIIVLPLLLLIVKGAVNVQLLAYYTRPEWGSIAFLVVLLAVWGPLATFSGGLYEATFRAMQGRDHAGSGFTLPGLRILTNVAQRQRTLLGALWYRALLNQSRNWFFWGRLVIILVAVALFPLLHTAIARYHISDATFVICYAAGVALLHAIETAVNAISGEASRLTLYLVAPRTLSRFLRAKLLLFAIPPCIEGIVIGCILAWRLNLPIGQSLLAIVLVALIVMATVSWLVLGSAWDEDINLAVEGPAQALVQEEMPISPRRLWLVNGCVLLYILLSTAVWKLPLLLTPLVFIPLNAMIIVGMSYMSLRQLAQQSR